MTFYQSFCGSGFNPVFPGSYDERIHSFRLPQEHQHSFHTYLPNLGSVQSQNVDLNYHSVSARNVPYPSFSGESGFHVPYANHAAVPNRFPSGPWANMCNGEAYCPMPPEPHGQRLNSCVSGCYNMIGNLVKPDPGYSSFSQPGHEYLFGCNAGWNQQPSDMGFVNRGNCMMGHPSQMQDHQFPANWQSYQQKKVVNSGNSDSFAGPHNCYIDERVQNSIVPWTEHRCEDSNTLDIQPSFVDNTNIQQPTFSCYSPHTQPCDVLEPSLDSNSSLDALLDITDFHTEDICDSELESRILQSLAEIPSLASTDFVVTSSSCAIKSPTNEVQASNNDTVSTAGYRFVSQAVPEVPQSEEKAVAAAESINTSDELSTAMKVTGCDQTSSRYSSSPKRTSSAESSAVVVSKVESCSALSNVITAGTSVTSTRMQFSDCQLQTDSSEKIELISAVRSAPVISPELYAASKCATSNRGLVPEVVIVSDVGNCEPTDAAPSPSDDVIILSPSSTDDEQTTTVSANVESEVKTQYCRMQPTSVAGHLTFDQQLRSVLRPVASKPLSVTLPHAGSSSNTVRVDHRGSSVLLPLTYRNFDTCRNHGVLPSRAKHIANHCNSIQMTSQRHLSYNAVTSTPHASCSCAKPLFCKKPVTHYVPAGQYSSHMQQRSCLKPLSLKLSLSEPKSSNTSLRTSNCCDSAACSQCTTLQKSSLQSSQASRHLGNAWLNNQERAVTTTQNASFISSRVSHTPLAVRANPKQSLFTNQKSYSLLRYSRDGSSLRLQDMSRRKNETYSVRAASILLQRIKQAKLSEIVSAHAARQHLLHRRLNSMSRNREVIDLTGDDDDGGHAYTADTCEFVFAQTRRRRTRMPLLRRPRSYFHRMGTLEDVSSCDTNVAINKTCAVDKSLPFYRCFVQNLLRNFRFTSSGVPVKVWYQEILPPAVPNRRYGNGDADSPACPSSPAQNFEENDDLSETTFSKIGTKELLMKRQPIVLLKRLDQSELNKYGVYDSCNENELEKGGDHAVNESDDASHNLQLEESEKYTETVSENVDSTDREQERITVNEIERENVAELNVAAKQTQRQLRLAELLALCRPVSVVLEHLDRIRIRYNDNELCKDEPRSQNNEHITPTGSEFSVSNLTWTVTQIPQANKVPILIMRISSRSALNASRKKVTKKSHPVQRLRSNFRCLRTRNCNAGTQSMRNLTLDSMKFNTSSMNILKRIPACRKLHFPTSVWGSKNAGHRLRRHPSALEARSPYRISSTCRSQQSTSRSTLLVKRAENATKTYSMLADPICKLERLASSVEQCLPSDSTLAKSSLTDSIPHDFAVNHSLSEHCRSSESDRSRPEFLPHSLMDSNSTDQGIYSAISDAFSKNSLKTYSVPNDTNDLPEDYASSDNDTVVMSPSASTDDLTIAYRSPISDVFDDDDLAPDQQESIDVSLDAGNGSKKFDMDAMDVDRELKSTLYPAIGEAASQPYTATVSESAVQSFSSLVKLSTFSTQFSCGTATNNISNTKQLQPTPVMLIESVNHGLERRPAVNSHLSEFVDEDRRWLYPSLQRFS